MNPARRLTLLALTAALASAIACNADDATGPSTAPPTGEQVEARIAQPLPNPPGRVATCTRQPYARVVKVVGPLGGTLKAGRHEFAIPRGALLAPVQITMEAVSDTVSSVRFSPSGLVFHPLHQPRLKLSYIGCKLPSGAKKKVAWVTESLLGLQVLPTREDSVAATANANLEHFSRYAVWY